MSELIKFENVFFKYENNYVLKNVNFGIKKGEYVAVIGGNGSAKSTLIKLMADILKPISGKITISDNKIYKRENKRKIGYVDQKSNSFNKSFPATVEEIVSLNLETEMKLFRKTNDNNKNKVDEILRTVELYHKKNKLIGELSGGELQKVFIAKALIGRPEILILDEPFVGIDTKGKEKLYGALRDLNIIKSTTILMVTHEIDKVKDEISKLLYLKDGSVVEKENKN